MTIAEATHCGRYGHQPRSAASAVDSEGTTRVSEARQSATSLNTSRASKRRLLTTRYRQRPFLIAALGVRDRGNLRWEFYGPDWELQLGLPSNNLRIGVCESSSQTSNPLFKEPGAAHTMGFLIG